MAKERRSGRQAGDSGKSGGMGRMGNGPCELEDARAFSWG